MSKKEKNNTIEAKQRKKNKKNSKRVGLFGFLFMISDLLARFFRKGFLGFIFADLYEKINDKWKQSFIYRFSRRENKKVHTHSLIVTLYENCKTTSFVANISKNIIHSKLKIWGARFFFFGFSMVIVSILKVYLVCEDPKLFLESIPHSDEMFNFVLAILIILISIPFLFSNRELGEGMLSHKFTRFILTDVLNLNANKFERGTAPSEGSYFMTILVSFSLGLATFFMPPVIMINTIILVAVLALIMSFPEIGILMLLVVIPFATMLPHPNTFVLSLVIFTICGFVSKFVRGKRILKFEFIDVLVLAIGTLLFFGGIFSAGNADSLKSSETYLAFLLMYFLIVNMYIRKPGIYRGLKVMVITGVIVSLVGVVYKVVTETEFIMTLLEGKFFDSTLSMVDNMLAKPQELGIYLVMIYPLALGQMLVTKKKFIKFLYLIAIATIMACVILTADITVCAGLVIATIAFMLIYNFRSVWLAIGAVMACLVAILVLPEGIVSSVNGFLAFSQDELANKLIIWIKVLGIIGNNLFSGIGIGKEAFVTAYYSDTALDPVFVSDSQNLFLQVLLELGIVGLIIFVFILLTFAQKCFVNTKSSNKLSRSRTMICAGYASILSACVMGLNTYIWSNYRVFLAFWIVLALTIALTKVNDKERESERVVNNMISVDIEID